MKRFCRQAKDEVDGQPNGVKNDIVWPPGLGIAVAAR